jgi:hypothetical protein
MTICRVSVPSHDGRNANRVRAFCQQHGVTDLKFEIDFGGYSYGATFTLDAEHVAAWEAERASWDAARDKARQTREDKKQARHNAYLEENGLNRAELDALEEHAEKLFGDMEEYRPGVKNPQSVVAMYAEKLAQVVDEAVERLGTKYRVVDCEETRTRLWRDGLRLFGRIWPDTYLTYPEDEDEDVSNIIGGIEETEAA